MTLTVSSLYIILIKQGILYRLDYINHIVYMYTCQPNYPIYFAIIQFLIIKSDSITLSYYNNLMCEKKMNKYTVVFSRRLQYASHLFFVNCFNSTFTVYFHIANGYNCFQDLVSKDTNNPGLPIFSACSVDKQVTAQNVPHQPEHNSEN